MIKRAREGGDVPHHVSLVDVDPDPQRVGDDKSQHYGGEQGLSVFFIEMKLRENSQPLLNLFCGCCCFLSPAAFAQQLDKSPSQLCLSSSSYTSHKYQDRH